jgi:hypothetical protein
MGGNLFKLGRLPRNDYFKIEREVSQYLDKKLGDFYRIPRYYGDKPDFGDLDIIVSSAAENWEQIRLQIIKDLEITQHKSIGHVFSTVYQNFQVDYFVIPAQHFESTYNFFCFNDLGNLLGKICRRFNLKYGEQGLAYVFRRNDENYKKDIILTKDFAKICEFLRVDFRKWEAGFANLEEMFEWAIASPYFSVEPYLKPSKSLENRAKDRRTIQKFIEYLQEKKLNKTFQYLENRDDYLPWLAENFPEANLSEKIATEKELENRENQIKAKFNGRILMKLLPHLEGKRLGEFIVSFKKSFDDFEQFILENSEEEINRQILDFARKFN